MEHDAMDKTKVHDVQPIRSLVPIFSSVPNNSTSPQPPPFVSMNPMGPFPNEFTPFYPFSIPPELPKPTQKRPQTPVAIPQQLNRFKNSISAPVPINSFRTQKNVNGDTGTRRSLRNCVLHSEEDVYTENSEYNNITAITNLDEGEIGGSGTVQKGEFQKRTRSSQSIILSSQDVESEDVVNNLVATYHHEGYNIHKDDGDRDTVMYILWIYNLLRRRISQQEDSKGSSSGGSKRPDLRAGTLMLTKGIRTNITKRIGTVPGVEVGDIFFFRMELCVVGLHAPSMGGIDYLSVRLSHKEDQPLAVSIVSSGGYEDDVEDGNILLYSGQGGNSTRYGKELQDQKLERGNLALERSLHQGNEVRVIRGMEGSSIGTKIYVYDGIYKIEESWMEKGKSGCNIFKYKFVRVPGQPESFTIWKSIQQWKAGFGSRAGVILPDLASGAENLPVCLVNNVDNEKGPTCFTYFPSLKYTDPIKPSSGCDCKSGCQSSKSKSSRCSCVTKNGGHLHYTGNGVLVDSTSVIYECGPSCSCPPTCKNRVSQTGLKLKLEVFKTKEKGWGLRSWDPIRVGAFVCEYAGEVFDKSKVEIEDDDSYVFDATRTYQPPEFMRGEYFEPRAIPFPLIISAKNIGNVGRFMNHSCSPNVVWQQVFCGDSSESDFHIAFYAIKHIPPMTELTFDYGVIESSNAEEKKKRCLCGSLKCRRYFY